MSGGNEPNIAEINTSRDGGGNLSSIRVRVNVWDQGKRGYQTQNIRYSVDNGHATHKPSKTPAHTKPTRLLTAYFVADHQLREADLPGLDTVENTMDLVDAAKEAANRHEPADL